MHRIVSVSSATVSWSMLSVPPARAPTNPSTTHTTGQTNIGGVGGGGAGGGALGSLASVGLGWSDSGLGPFASPSVRSGGWVVVGLEGLESVKRDGHRGTAATR